MKKTLGMICSLALAIMQFSCIPAPGANSPPTEAASTGVSAPTPASATPALQDGRHNEKNSSSQNAAPVNSDALNPPLAKVVRKKGVRAGLARAISHTTNAIGFPIGEDHTVNANKSGDQRNTPEARERLQQALTAAKPATPKRKRIKRQSRPQTNAGPS